MLEFAKVCDYLTPTTLASVIVDVDESMDLPPCSDLDLAAVRNLACEALNANVGEDEAAVLIETAKRH